jgi:hypothetical protein
MAAQDMICCKVVFQNFALFEQKYIFLRLFQEFTIICRILDVDMLSEYQIEYVLFRKVRTVQSTCDIYCV